MKKLILCLAIFLFPISGMDVTPAKKDTSASFSSLASVSINPHDPADVLVILRDKNDTVVGALNQADLQGFGGRALATMTGQQKPGEIPELAFNDYDYEEVSILLDILNLNRWVKPNVPPFIHVITQYLNSKGLLFFDPNNPIAPITRAIKIESLLDYVGLESERREIHHAIEKARNQFYLNKGKYIDLSSYDYLGYDSLNLSVADVLQSPNFHKDFFYRNLDAYGVLDLSKQEIGNLAGIDMIVWQIPSSSLEVSLPRKAKNISSINLNNNPLRSLLYQIGTEPPRNFSDIVQAITETNKEKGTTLELHLSRTSLKELPQNFLENPHSLRILDLSRNTQLSSVNQNFLGNTPQLQSLYLSGSTLKELPRTFLSQAPELKTLFLHRNNLVTLAQPFIPQSKKIVDIALYENRIVQAPMDFLMNAPESLRFLGLEGNLFFNDDFRRDIIPALPEHVKKAIALGSALYPKFVQGGGTAIYDELNKKG